MKPRCSVTFRRVVERDRVGQYLRRILNTRSASTAERTGEQPYRQLATSLAPAGGFEIPAGPTSH